MLKYYDHLPAGFLDAAPEALETLLGGPALISLPGRREPALFACVLLHGNETTGVYAVQRLLRRHREALPRSLELFVGNVSAARHGLRHLDGQPDYNRIWPGGEATDSPETRMAAELTAHMRRRGLFASVDVHNNTGWNPHYGCINRLDGPFLYLASLFARTVVYFTRPAGVQSLAFAEFCPAVTLECGLPGREEGIQEAEQLLDALLHLRELPDHPALDGLGVYQTVARVRVPEDVAVGFDAGVPLRLLDDIERLNFRELPAGTALARVAPDSDARLRVEDNEGRDVTSEYLELADGELRMRRHVMPAMLSRDLRVIRQDCLGYLMRPVALDTA
ncbi:M14 family metallopeptidase [Alkalilimnicola sp. S0819]|uniref:M14 family metallopeptidase n=1 Tax=Alkalilimnicola sp. S0819 TaxID=2613922 RepID=UPI00126244ED|nr:M14 family metallopeptidase [Alkalilimnicola sp. S0819]KAB7623763.1 peptidase M14 [Alkalilimnicola sp. S0819]MPQ16635.1 peptidase M14 [Alkalilimnicola sp. S0819]